MLSESYTSAVTLFKEKLTKSECEIIWAEKHTGIGDLQAALQEAKKKYDNRKAHQSSVRTWLSMFSSRLMYYGGILDVVSTDSKSLQWHLHKLMEKPVWPASSGVCFSSLGLNQVSRCSRFEPRRIDFQAFGGLCLDWWCIAPRKAEAGIVRHRNHAAGHRSAIRPDYEILSESCKMVLRRESKAYLPLHHKGRR